MNTISVRAPHGPESRAGEAALQKAAQQPASPEHEPGVFLAEPDVPARRDAALWASRTPWPVLSFPTLGELVEGVPATRPGCILLGLAAGNEHELESLLHLPAQGFHHPVIVLIDPPDLRVAVRAMRCGAMNVLHKAAAAEELPPAIEEAMGRNQELRRHVVQRSRASQRFAQLSEAEREVLDLVLRGRPNRAIAQELRLSVRAIEVRRAKSCARCGPTAWRNWCRCSPASAARWRIECRELAWPGEPPARIFIRG